jgi:ribosome-binding factor A
MAMPKRRQERVTERIHQELSDLLLRRIHDPRLTFVTVTDVEVTPDLKLATVFVSVLGDQEAAQSALAGLQHASSFIRRELAHTLEMRVVPELRFLLDDSWERGARIDALLERLPPPAPNEEPEETGADQDTEED